MRIKKILSLAVVLAMVMAVVPAFGLTASAAEAVSSSYFYGWNFSKGEIRNDLGVETAEAAVVSWDAATNDRVSFVEFDLPQETNIEETQFLKATISMLAYGNNGSGGNVTPATIFAVDTDAVESQENGKLVAARASKIKVGTINFEFTAEKQWNNNPSTGEVLVPASSIKSNKVAFMLSNSANDDADEYGIATLKQAKLTDIKVLSPASVNVQYVKAEDNQTVIKDKAITEEGLFSGDSYTPITSKYYVDMENHTLYTIGSVSETVLQPNENVIKVPLTAAYKISGSNIIENGSFEEVSGDEIAGWRTGSGTQILKSTLSFNIDNANATEGSNALNTKYTSYVNGALDAADSLHGEWKLKKYVSDNNNYLISFDAKTWKGTTTFAHLYKESKNGEETAIVGKDNEHIEFNTQKMTPYQVIIPTDEQTSIIGYRAGWFQDASTYYDNFVLYELAPLNAVKYSIVYTTDGQASGEAFKDEDLYASTGSTITMEEGAIGTVLVDNEYYTNEAVNDTVAENGTIYVKLKKTDENGLTKEWNFADDNSDLDVGSNVTVKNGIAVFPGGIGNDSTNYIKANDNSFMENIDKNMTISMWVKKDAEYNNDKTIPVIDFANGNYDRTFYQLAGSKITVQNREDVSRAVEEVNEVSDFNTEKWNLVTISYDLLNRKTTLYINGTAVETTHSYNFWGTDASLAAMLKRSSSGNSTAIYIGANQWMDDNNEKNNNPLYKGGMADVRIYNYALSASEIQNIYNTTQPKTVTVNYVDGESQSVKEPTIVDTFVENTTIELPTTINKDSKTYVLTGVEYEPGSETVEATTEEATYTAKYVVQPDAPTASLGWNGTDFTINFDGGKAGQTIKVYHETADGTLEAVTEGAPAELTGDQTGIAITPENTNRIYAASIVDAVEGVRSGAVSLYSLVVDEIVAEKAEEKFGEKQLAKINEIISAGGVYYGADGLTALPEATAKIFDLGDTDDGKKTVTVNDAFTKFNFGFVYHDGTIYLGSAPVAASGGTDGTVYQKLTIDVSNNTVTFESVAGTAEAITLSLDSVNIEFVETLIEELESDGADAAQDFIPEL